MRLRKILYPLLPVLLVIAWLVLRPVPTPLDPVSAERLPSSFKVSNVYRVAQLTGSSGINSTGTSYAVRGTDLGIMWDNGHGQLLVAFGDTYGLGWGGCGAGPGWADWRSNTLAFVNGSDPAAGLQFSGMLEDRPGHAREIISSLKLDGLENTIIPTGGVSVGSRNYLFYMSVKQWGQPGSWETNYSGVTYSDDFGRNWQASPLPRWENLTGSAAVYFQQITPVKSGNYLYLFGTPNGRAGSVYLARVAAGQVLNSAAYQYWDGESWLAGLGARPTPVAPAPAGELSVYYSPYFQRWLMTTLDQNRQAIIMRDAPDVTGPWSEPLTLVEGASFPQLYGAFIHPWFSRGQDLYFNMSQWCAPDVSYNVSLMHVTLSLANVKPVEDLLPDVAKLKPPSSTVQSEPPGKPGPPSLPVDKPPSTNGNGGQSGP